MVRIAGWLFGMFSIGLLWQTALPRVEAEAEFPLPAGVSRLREPTQVDVGSSTLFVQMFLTDMEEGALMTFYRKALPKAGWKLGWLPWQAGHASARQRMERALALRRDLPDTARAKLRQVSETLTQTAQAMQKQLYATRGTEHVIVNLWPMEQQGTMVFINRWGGSRAWMDAKAKPQWATSVPAPRPAGIQDHPASTGSPEAFAQSGGPMTNVCCSADEVPDLQGPLPFFIPRYPQARAIARSSSQSGQQTTVLLMAPASAAQIAAYYQTEMPRDGWELLKEQRASPRDGATAQTLAFRKPGRLCIVTIQGAAEGSSSEASQTMVRISVEPSSSGRAL